jgi:hypothetical protein
MRKLLRQVRVLAGNVGRPNHSAGFEQDHAPLQRGHMQSQELDAQPSKFASGSGHAYGTTMPDTGGCNGLLGRQAFLVRDCRSDRSGDFGRGVLAPRSAHSASGSGDDEFAGGYADSSVNKRAEAVKPAKRSG